MGFHASGPVTADGFFNRTNELQRLGAIVSKLETTRAPWIALIGPRKVGKTSLVLELAHRSTGLVKFVVLDVAETEPAGPEVVRHLAAEALDQALAGDAGCSLRALLSSPADFRAALPRSKHYLNLRPDIRSIIDSLVAPKLNHTLLRGLLQLPEELARELGLRFLVAIDEFQLLADVAIGGHKKGVLLPLLRSVWQRHERVAYIISGSAKTMLKGLVTSEASPFFMHFDILEIGPFTRDDAAELLVRCSPRQRSIPQSLAARAVDVLGGHPFYVQLFGESLTLRDPPYDERALKETLQGLLFNKTGRLSLFFLSEYERVVGRSTTLAAALRAVANGPARTVDIQATMRATSSGSVVHYLERLGDTVERLDDDRYTVADPAFAAWLRWRSPGGSTVPMSVIGSDAEIEAARHLAGHGFDLIYQARASRGAFDLLATRGPEHLGVQVKKTNLPVRFKKTEWSRMEADARRLGWSWVVIVVCDDNSVVALDPSRAQKRREVQLAEDGTIENLLQWLDEKRR